MDANQLGRRNLTPDQRKIIIGRRYNREKLKGFKGNQYTTLVDDKLSTTKTADKLADENNISDRTVIRCRRRSVMGSIVTNKTNVRMLQTNVQTK